MHVVVHGKVNRWCDGGILSEVAAAKGHLERIAVGDIKLAPHHDSRRALFATLYLKSARQLVSPRRVERWFLDWEGGIEIGLQDVM